MSFVVVIKLRFTRAVTVPDELLEGMLWEEPCNIRNRRKRNILAVGQTWCWIGTSVYSIDTHMIAAWVSFHASPFPCMPTSKLEFPIAQKLALLINQVSPWGRKSGFRWISAEITQKTRAWLTRTSGWYWFFFHSPEKFSESPVHQRSEK